uniref:Uncharacterized protein n=1 Tax=Oryza sativa subsp. japonica TaxID=39947 RepID=Q6YW70_ORYSJ|nr:hypothetical protein [Oryza sativa Japonica Group]BAD05819.1 hypothetical protein [Oryza sativa Japonica Group]
MGQELRTDTMNWAKIHKSVEWSNRGGHQSKLGWIGPAPGSAETGGSAEPILAPLDPCFGVDVQDCIPMTVGGHFAQFPFHNRHNYLYIRSSLSSLHTNLKQ